MTIFSRRGHLVIYPNINSGKTINICCNENVKVLEIINSLGQKIAFKTMIKASILTIEPTISLVTGIYFIKVLDQYNKEQVFKMIVNY